MLLAEQFFVNGFVWFAEREGFEPSVPCGTHAFQACSIGHSDTSPGNGVRIYDLYQFTTPDGELSGNGV